MYQSDRGSYRKHETLASMFWHSCLGKLVILAGIIGVLAFIASLTRPSERYMREQMYDNIRQCIESPDSIQTDAIDDAVANFTYIFTSAGPVENKALMARFNQYNRIEYFEHSTYSSLHIFNNFRPEGVRCAIGIFGIVIPTINFNDLLLRTGPVRRDYDSELKRKRQEQADSIDEIVDNAVEMFFKDPELPNVLED
jgi:hypothetical protein